MDKIKSTITLTFGDQAENHVGMKKIGTLAKEGFSVKELKKIKETLECEIVDLNFEDLPEAAILILRNGVNKVLKDKSVDDLFSEQSVLEVDKKAFMYGRVVNKQARHNLCFNETKQEPDYENKKGRIIAFEDVPITNQLRLNLPEIFGEKTKNLIIEGNYYYDIKTCGIGYHGDKERRIVVGVRLGASLPLHYQWFKNSKPIGDTIK